MARKLRVCLVIQAPAFGGAHNQAISLAEGLHEAGYSTVVYLSADGAHLNRLFTQIGIECRVVQMGRLRARKPLSTLVYLGLLPVQILRLGRLFRRDDIDLVQVHGVTNIDVALAAAHERLPIVWQILDSRAPFVLQVLVAPLIQRLAGAVLVTGKSMLHGTPLAGLDPARVHSYMPPARHLSSVSDETRAKARSKLTEDQNNIIVGMLANVNQQKGHLDFIKAWSLLPADTKAVATLRGSTGATSARYLRKLLSRAGESRLSVSLEELSADMSPEVFLSAIDLLVVPSVRRSEGIPTVILEAMVQGVPVVASDVGSVREVVRDGFDGVIVPPSQPGILALELQRLLRHPDRIQGLGEAAARAAETRSTDGTVTSYVGAYNQAIRGQRR